MQFHQLVHLLVWVSTMLLLFYALLGFDCTARGMNYTALSLLDVGDCELSDVQPDTQTTKIQLKRAYI